MSRLFYIALGATATIIVVRRANAIAARVTPEGLAIEAGTVREHIRVWWAEVKDAAAQRELELRAGLGIAGPDDESVQP